VVDISFQTKERLKKADWAKMYSYYNHNNNNNVKTKNIWDNFTLPVETKICTTQFEMPAGFLFVFIHLMKMIFQKYQETIIIH
jgi:hypothetical protein